MKTCLGRAFASAAVAALCVLSVRAGAEVPAASPLNGTATLTLTFELKGTGVERPASHEKNVTWTMENRYTVTATMTAQKPGGFGAMHKPDAAEQAREAERAAAVGAAAGSMQSMMEQAEQIMKLCGDDEACITRESMKMSQGVDMSSPEMQAAKANVAAASVMPEARYQIFAPVTQSATFAVKEVAHEAYYDAACSPATEASCSIDTTVSGQGDTTDGGDATVFATAASAEIDYQRGSLLLNLTVPGMAKVQKTVASKVPEVASGTTDVIRMIRFGDVAEDPLQVSCGACTTASGSFERDVTDELLGRPAKLVVTWSFKRS
jgi:hypothetical protein